MMNASDANGYGTSNSESRSKGKNKASGGAHSKQKEFRIEYMQSDYVSLKTFKQRFHVLSEIGRGGQAYVKEAVDLQNNQHVALKIYKKSKMTLTNLNQAHFENDITRTFDDPTILKNIGYFEDQEYICIIFELMHTNLRHLLSQENLREDILSEYNVCRMFAKMVRSIVVCHEANIIHRDVKLENFLAHPEDF